jgi:hypothetical protein
MRFPISDLLIEDGTNFMVFLDHLIEPVNKPMNVVFGHWCGWCKSIHVLALVSVSKVGRPNRAINVDCPETMSSRVYLSRTLKKACKASSSIPLKRQTPEI